jgi:hypothetical protein
MITEATLQPAPHSYIKWLRNKGRKRKEEAIKEANEKREEM